MIINNFYIIGVIFMLFETNPVFVIYPNRILAVSLKLKD